MPSPSRFSKFFSLQIYLLFAISIAGCSFSFIDLEYRRAKSAEEKGDFSKALERYERVMLREPDGKLGLQAAREASRIATLEKKDFSRAIKLYSHLINYSPRPEERRAALESVANIALENTQNFPLAIETFNKLLAFTQPPEKFVDYKQRLAKAYYYQGEFAQAETELEAALTKVEKGPKYFEIEHFRASIFFNTNRLDEATKLYEKLLQDFPAQSEEQNVAMSLVVAYEEAEQFDKALDRISKMRNTYKDPEFLDLKAARLKERKANLPGARGLRK